VKIAPAFTVVALLVATHCSKDRKETGASAPDATSAPAAASAPTASGASHPGPGARSVYPLDAGAPDPIVHELCSALHDLPEQRRAACCDQGSGVVVTSECERMLTFAVGSRAASLDALEVDRCVAAMQKAHEGCDWVGPFPPETPAECQGLVHGSLDAGAPCRSSLECAKGLRCHGVGPTLGGVCGKAHEDGQACGAAVDTLAVFVKEKAQVESVHPECAGYCDRLRCAPLLPLGEACRSGAQCADGACKAAKCAPRASAKPGEPCPSGECTGDARCIAGQCVERRDAGSACKTDFECRGACIRLDGGPGTCGKRCDAR